MTSFLFLHLHSVYNLHLLSLCCPVHTEVLHGITRKRHPVAESELVWAGRTMREVGAGQPVMSDPCHAFIKTAGTASTLFLLTSDQSSDFL